MTWSWEITTSRGGCRDKRLEIYETRGKSSEMENAEEGGNERVMANVY